MSGSCHPGATTPSSELGPRRDVTRSRSSNTSGHGAMRTSTAPAIVTPGRDPADYDDDALDRLADRIADRLAVRLARPHAHRRPARAARGRSRDRATARQDPVVGLRARRRARRRASWLGPSTPTRVLTRARGRAARDSRQASDHAPARARSAAAPTPACQSHGDGGAAAACAVPRGLDRLPAVPGGHRSTRALPRTPDTRAEAAR